MTEKKCLQCQAVLRRAERSQASAWRKKKFCNPFCKRAYHYTPATKKTDLERFEEKYIPEPNSGCWLWMGGLRDGYGTLRISGKMAPAHKFIYEKTISRVAEGMVLDHRCRVRSCVNPQHLEPVTNQENVLRGALLKTHCPQGHPYSGENLYIYRGTQRRCKTCMRERNKRSVGDTASAASAEETDNG
jgi:hypothetical protein